jgi:hypothetical protein
MGIGKCLGFGRLATLFRREFDGVHSSCTACPSSSILQSSRWQGWPQIQHCGWEVEGIILRTSTANGTETTMDSSSLPFEALPSIESVTVRYNPPR